jgi:PAS domain-containing protein
VSRYDAAFADVLADSYAELVGRPFVTAGLRGAAAAEWLYQARFGLLAHDTSADPLFTYANRTAQERFGYTWDEFVGLPSRLSAIGDARDERHDLMDSVRRHGFADEYRGLRVTKSGRPFWIEDVTIWNLLGPGGLLIGQAALIRQWPDA